MSIPFLNVFIMSEASRLVSDSITGDCFKSVVLGGKMYIVYAPTIYIIGRALKHLSKISIGGAKTTGDIISHIPTQGEFIAEALSVLITGDSLFRACKCWYLRRRIIHSTPKELSEAFESAISLIQAQDFFECATLAAKVANQMAKQK